MNEDENLTISSLGYANKQAPLFFFGTNKGKILAFPLLYYSYDKYESTYSYFYY